MANLELIEIIDDDELTIVPNYFDGDETADPADDTFRPGADPLAGEIGSTSVGLTPPSVDSDIYNILISPIDSADWDDPDVPVYVGNIIRPVTEINAPGEPIYAQFSSQDALQVVLYGGNVSYSSGDSDAIDAHIQKYIINNATVQLWAKQYWESANAGSSESSSQATDIGDFGLFDQTIDSDYTIPDGKNALSSGPVTVVDGVTVTVGTGETWTIV